MTKLFQKTYPANSEGWATMRLACVASEIADHRGLPLDAHTRLRLIVEMHKISRDDLSEDKRSLYDEFKTYLDME